MGQATVLLLVAPVLFGTTGTAQALAGAQAAPLAIGGLRLAVGGFALAVVALVSGGSRRCCGCCSASRCSPQLRP